VAQFPAQLLTRRFELTTLSPHASWPRILPQRVDHRTANATLGKRLELDATGLVEPVSRINQPDDPVLHQVTDIDRMGHRRGDATGKLFDERYARDHAGVVTASLLGAAHLDPPGSS